MKILVLCASVLGLISCSSVPKGEYSRSEIDRPYALPDDVASFSFGSAATVYHTDDEDVESEDQEEGYSSTLLGFEQGISNNVSWIYPLGLKWNIHSKDKHTFGLSFYTLILYTTTSLDYWYRINEKFSLRPYFRTKSFNFFFVEEDLQGPGVDLVFQATEKFAMTFGYSAGTFSGSSDFLDILLTGSNEESVTKVDGTFSVVSLKLLYSIHERWDLSAYYGIETRETDRADYDQSTLSLAATFYY